MMNVEEMREIIPVTLGAMAFTFARVSWHCGSDKETILAMRFDVLQLCNNINTYAQRVRASEQRTGDTPLFFCMEIFLVDLLWMLWLNCFCC